jgi:single-strand DNA-binding protein
MKNLSYVILDGNLVSDPELKELSSGKNVANFTLAINHSSEEDDVSFVDIEAWDKLGENCEEYLNKGSRVTVLGNLKQDRWKTQDGNSRNKIKVVASTVRFDSTNKEKRKVA